jgi:hypothetical protein
MCLEKVTHDHAILRAIATIEIDRTNLNNRYPSSMMCQHFSEHNVKQLCAAIRSLVTINSHWLIKGKFSEFRLAFRSG